MNAVERKTKRKLRLIVIRQIEVIEANNCLVCPNRKSQDFECCKTCPVPSQLNELGKQLIAVSNREEQPKKGPEEEKRTYSIQYGRRLERQRLGLPSKKIPKVKTEPSRRRKKGEPSIKFTAEDYIRAIAGGDYKSEIARKIGMPDSTLYHRTVKWGLVGLTRDQAREMLNRSIMGGDIA